MGPKKVVDDELVTKNKVVSQRTCNKKKKTSSSTPFLPNEIIFYILKWLPADILYNTMRYICKGWYDIIKDPHFAREQVLVSSTTGICFQCNMNEIVYFAQFGKKKGTLSELVTFPSGALVKSICNGLLVFHNPLGGPTYIANPLTKQLFTLPPRDSVSKRFDQYRVFRPCKAIATVNYSSYSIGFTRSPFELKVVFTCFCNYGLARYGVYTLGKDDDWRINTNEKLSIHDTHNLFSKRPLSAGKFLHWVRPYSDYIITMDMESEEIYISTAPKSVKSDTPDIIVEYVVRGDFLTCMVGTSNTMLWEVWVCLDIIGNQWESFNIDFRPQKCRFRRMVKHLFGPKVGSKIKPVAWIENGEVIIFKPLRPPRPFIAYNVNTGYAFQLRGHDDHHYCEVFTSSYAPSLLSLN